MCVITHSSFGLVHLCMVEQQGGGALQALLSATMQCDGVRTVGSPHVSLDTSGLS